MVKLFTENARSNKTFSNKTEKRRTLNHFTAKVADNQFCRTHSMKEIHESTKA